MPDLRVFRSFPWDDSAPDSSPGGCLYFHRAKQGTGRHDSPDDYGVFYCAASPESAIAEQIHPFRGQKLAEKDLVRFGFKLALVELELPVTTLVDLDEAAHIEAYKTRPSIIASPLRPKTQALARTIFTSKVDAISWWSTLYSPWTNYSVFVKGTQVKGKIISGPSRIDLDHGGLRSAASILGVTL